MDEAEFESLHQELADRLDDIQLLLQTGDRAEVARQLHSLKGLAKAFVFNEFACEVHAAEGTEAAPDMAGKLDRLYRFLDAA